MSSHLLRILSADDVLKALPLAEAITAMKEAFTELSAGNVTAPLRTSLEMPGHKGRALIMPVFVPSTGLVGMKFITLHEDNPKRGLPLIHALVLLFRADTGEPVALVDGESLTVLRTAAASGLATDLLARKDASVAAVFGAGLQGRWQLAAVHTVRPLTRAYILDKDAARANQAASEMGDKLGINVIAASIDEGLRDADVICTATSSPTPVFEHRQLKPGVHINAIGAYRPETAEIPPETVAAAKVVVDERSSCLAEAGDILQPIQQGLIGPDHIYAELGEITAGKREGRTSAEEITFFKSVGNAVQDAVAGKSAIDAATKQNLGETVELGELL